MKFCPLHPEKKARAHGLCESCYKRRWERGAYVDLKELRKLAAEPDYREPSNERMKEINAKLEAIDAARLADEIAWVLSRGKKEAA